jgi:hypothetical protein
VKQACQCSTVILLILTCGYELQLNHKGTTKASLYVAWNSKMQFAHGLNFSDQTVYKCYVMTQTSAMKDIHQTQTENKGLPFLN